MTGSALSNLVEPLLSFGEGLGIPSECWAEREELGQIRYANSEFSRESAISLTLEHITPLLQAYGDAFSCHFRLGDLTVLNITQATSEADLYNFQSQTQDSPTLELSFKLNKKQLIQDLLEESPTHKFHLYLFPQALERLLSSLLEQLESQLWNAEPARKVIMLVPSRQIWLDGPYLAILGGEKVKDYQEVLPQKLPDSEELQSIYHKCRDILKWQEVKLQYLTPLHFKVAGQTRPNDQIAKAVRVHLAKLIVLYTADRTVIRTNGHWLATYVGARQSVDLVPGDLANLSDEEISSGVNVLLKMFEWTYDLQRIDDRLPLLQITVIQPLQIEELSERYQLLVRRASYIFKELQWHWKVFAEGKVDSYIEQVRTLEDYVASIVQSFTDQVSSMIKNLSETMLAAVGVFLGSFIAALFQDRFNPTIFRFGVLTYGFYVFLFPLCYNMSHQWQHYKTLCNNFDLRRQRFKKRLYSQKVKEIVGEQVVKSQENFRYWFKRILLAYIALIILALAAAVLAPNFIPSSVPTVTPTPGTPTPTTPAKTP